MICGTHLQLFTIQCIDCGLQELMLGAVGCVMRQYTLALAYFLHLPCGP
jgi:hypothetical protein